MINPMTGNMEEIDECSLMPGVCGRGRCMNTVGSYSCDCDPGFTLDRDSHSCVDINECSDSAPCSGLAQCTNTQVDYHT